MASPGKDLTRGSVPGHIAKLSGFMMAGFIANNAAQIIETIYLGMVGTTELAAIAFAFPVVFGLNAIGRGIAQGAASLMSRARGSGNDLAVKRYGTHCMVLVLIFAIVSVLGGWLVARPFYSMLGATGTTLDMVVLYTNIWLWGFPMYVLGTVGPLLLRGIGNAPVPAIVMGVSSVIQIAVAPPLIFGWWRFEAMGITGAAIAFVVSRAVAFFVALYWIVIRDPILTHDFDDFLASSRQILHIGLPAAVNNCIPPISAGIVTWLLASHGDLGAAAFGVATKIGLLFWMMMAAVASSTAPVVGQNWGARLFERVERAMLTAYSACLTWSVVTLIVFVLWAGDLVAIINAEPEIIAVATTYLVVIATTLGFVGIQNAASFCFNTIGKPVPGLILSILRLIVLYIPIALIADAYFGYLGVFWATASVNLIAGSIGWAWLHFAIRSPRVRGIATYT